MHLYCFFISKSPYSLLVLATMRLILFIILFPFCLFAQHPYFVNYTDKDGLPCNELYSILQSKTGCIWIGSDAGLVRFDGLEFKLYRNSATKNQSITKTPLFQGRSLNKQAILYFLKLRECRVHQALAHMLKRNVQHHTAFHRNHLVHNPNAILFVPHLISRMKGCAIARC